MVGSATSNKITIKESVSSSLSWDVSEGRTITPNPNKIKPIPIARFPYPTII